MVFSHLKPRFILIKTSASLCSNRIPPSVLQKRSIGVLKPQAPNTLIFGTLSLNRLLLVSAMSFLGGARRLVHNSPGFLRFRNSSPKLSQTQRIFAAIARFSQRAKQSSAKLSAGKVAATVFFGSALVFFVLGGRIERIPYSKRFHYTLSYKLDEKLNKWCEEEIKSKPMLSPSDPRTIRVQSIAKNIIEAMNKGLLLKHDVIMEPTPEPDSDATLLNKKAHNFGVNLDNLEVRTNSQEMIQQSQNRTRKHLWKPATKHLDGKVWELYIADSTGDNADNVAGKIVIDAGLLSKLNSDAEIATIIAHQIGHAVARHVAEYTMKGLVICLLMVVCMICASATGNIQTNFLIIKAGGCPHILLLICAFYLRRGEIEADYIGLMLMASAGYDPEVAPVVYEERLSCNRKYDVPTIFNTNYPGKKRAELLKRKKTMELAKEVFKEVKAGYEVRSFV